ncbi:MAG: HAD-IA family hydrolase, partial [Burkholderiales bacterium]
MIKAILFDLDGTLADTAPDLTFALNRVRGARGLPPLPLAATRPYASQGARGLIGVGFDLHPGDPGYDALRDEFLSAYAENLCRETRLFAGMPELLDRLDARALPWGVVTNKAERFTLPLLDLLELRSRAACVIGGDTTGRIKPHPEPLLAASRAIALAPSACVYVGDDRRDVEAGQAAGMKTAVARWGYL